MLRYTNKLLVARIADFLIFFLRTEFFEKTKWDNNRQNYKIPQFDSQLHFTPTYLPPCLLVCVLGHEAEQRLITTTTTTITSGSGCEGEREG